MSFKIVPAVKENKDEDFNEFRKKRDYLLNQINDLLDFITAGTILFSKADC